MHVQALVAKAAVEYSTKAVSVGLPGRLKSSVTPFSYAQRSSAFEMNSGPLSTRMVLGTPRIPPNYWRTISGEAATTIAAQPTGNERVTALFREVLDRPIPRDVIEATARQKDFMRRIRADGGRGTRDLLANEGILLLSGKYDAALITALELGPVPGGDFISHRVMTDAERAIAAVHGALLAGGPG